MTAAERIDANLDRILRASGSAGAGRERGD